MHKGVYIIKVNCGSDFHFVNKQGIFRTLFFQQITITCKFNFILKTVTAD